MYDARAAGAKCDQCALCGPGRAPKCVPPVGPPNARIALVGEAPGKNEIDRGKPFVGASGIKLDELLWHSGVRRADVFVSNALLCRPEAPHLEGRARFDVDEFMKWLKKENGRRAAVAKAAKKAKTTPAEDTTPIGDPFDCCKPRLLAELRWLDQQAQAAGAPNGLVVMPLGNYALRTLRGVTGIMKWRGSVTRPRVEA